VEKTYPISATTSDKKAHVSYKGEVLPNTPKFLLTGYFDQDKHDELLKLLSPPAFKGLPVAHNWPHSYWGVKCNIYEYKLSKGEKYFPFAFVGGRVFNNSSSASKWLADDTDGKNFKELASAIVGSYIFP
jgi:hypothetical protein